MEPTTLNASVRSVTGKGAARKLRATGRIPATVYGGGIAPVTIGLDPGDITLLRRAALGWNTPLALNIEGADDVPLAMLRDVQKHPLTGAVLHADFLRIDAEQQVEVSVRIDLDGRAVGVAHGGLLNRPIRRLTVRCLPSQIPAAISVDVTEMVIGDKVMIDELVLPAGVTILFADRVPVITLVGRRGGGLDEEEETDEEAEETEEEEEEE